MAREVQPPPVARGVSRGAAVLPVAAVSVERVSQMFPHTLRANIERHLPAVLDALGRVGLADKPMVLMALASIRAETESFRPISEGQSQFNTPPGGPPFALYDSRADLGNLGPPDGAAFKGRGFIQLTGRSNYARISRAIGMDDRLVSDPELANDPGIAATILAAFLKAQEASIRSALLAGDLKKARRLVNGGSHGLDRFTDAFQIGSRVIN